MKIRCETINPFFTLLNEIKKGKFNEYKIRKLLEHPDYTIEFKRYDERPDESKVTKNDFIKILESINNNEIDIPQKVNQQRREVISNFIDKFNEMKSQWNNFSLEDTDVIADAIKIARFGLPNGVNFDQIDLLFTISIGNSFGWPYDNIVHFDVVQLCEKYQSLTDMKFFLAHEIHHIGFTNFLKKINTTDESLIFLHFLAYEGLALKFCNYPNGNLLSHCLNEKYQNNTLWENDWIYFKNNSEYYFKLFIHDYEDIKNKKVSLPEKIYINWKTEKRLDGKNKLNQYPNYFIGSEIFGILIDDYGVKTVFEILSGETVFSTLFNTSMERRKLNYIIKT